MGDKLLEEQSQTPITREYLMELFEARDPGNARKEVPFKEFERGLTIFGKADSVPENFSAEEITELKTTLGLDTADAKLDYEKVIDLLLATNQPHTVASLSDN